MPNIHREDINWVSNPFCAQKRYRPITWALGVTVTLCAYSLSQPFQQPDPKNQQIPILPLAGISFFTGSKKRKKLADLKLKQQELEHRNEELITELNEAKGYLEKAEYEILQFKKIHFASLQRFQTLFNELPLPCFTVNEIGHVIEWNRAAVSFFGLEPYQVIDQPIANILGEDVYRGHAQENIYEVFLGRQPGPAIVNVSRRNGDPQRVKWITSPVKNQQGQVVGAVNTLGILPAGAKGTKSEENQQAA